ncbi:hypothetical protein THASP1DRAFT_28460 [Thamnocephalis sphaerospora]|uniref:FAS1 domain-containing protein n=1 Tax=Thamnocephalis sphaerospora TaxID=78915 RepID=A0A4P9XU61_9FUNG|nr:hypothetical protein THASP1DRAFT_28460 [Thamnocephalis sphaerospora]|eukprot:RKP09748.1 hypothetical protein THASP1DRAFT_28460 [Thamnocephalis sphaerospora]
MTAATDVGANGREPGRASPKSLRNAVFVRFVSPLFSLLVFALAMAIAGSELSGTIGVSAMPQELPGAPTPKAGFTDNSALPLMQPGQTPALYPEPHPPLKVRGEITNKTDGALLTPADVTKFQNKDTSGYTILDALYFFENSTNFYTIATSIPRYKERLSDKNLRITMFVPLDSGTIFQKGWKQSLQSNNGSAEYSYVFSYHIVTNGLLNLGKLANETNAVLRSNSFEDDSKSPLPIIARHGGRQMYINCATVIREPYVLSNGVIYFLNQPLDPWLEGTAAQKHVQNGGSINCTALLSGK